jgi:hypothetical protein
LQKRIDLAKRDLAERSQPTRQRSEEPTHLLFPRRYGNRRKAALDTHVLHECVQFLSEPKRPIGWR